MERHGEGKWWRGRSGRISGKGEGEELVKQR